MEGRTRVPGVWTEDVAPVPPASALRRAPPRARVSSRGRACGAGGVSAPRLPSRPLFEGLPSESCVSQQAALAGGADTRAAATGTQRCGPGGPCGEAQAGLVFPSPPSPQSHVWLSPAGLVEVRAEQRGRGRVSVDRAGLPSLVSLWAEPPAPQLPAAGREATGSALRGLGRRFRQDARGLLFGLWRSGRWQGTDGSRRASTCSWPRARRRGPPPCPSLTGGGRRPACPSRPCA